MAETVMPRTFKVGEIAYYLKEYLAEERMLTSVAVEGEVTGFRAHSSGHLYFTLREGEAGLKAVMFRGRAQHQSWRPKDGEQVIVVGSISLYQRDCTCQLYAEAIFPAGSGKDAQALDALKRKLEAEGLFAPERKQPLPAAALNVGVITGAESAAWADIRRIATNRCPAATLTLYPAIVQGALAPASIVDALARADNGGHTVLICGRGGGAGEDLAAFNNEQVVRAIAAAKTPLISAVGHESDVSLADLAADMRAATPTHAATLALPDSEVLCRRLDELLSLMHRNAQRVCTEKLGRLIAANNRLLRHRPDLLLGQAHMQVDRMADALQRTAKQQITAKFGQTEALAERLRLLDPLAVLSRGYALAETADGQILQDATAVVPGDKIRVRLDKGSLTAVVEASEKEGA